MSPKLITQLIEENIKNIIDLEEDIQNNSRELDKFPARLKRYSLARAQALINLNQIDSTISDLERFLWLEESEILNKLTESERITRFYKLSKLTRLNKTDENLGCYLSHLKNIRSKIANCGAELSFKICSTTGKVRLTDAKFCMNHMLCPLCAIRRSAKISKAYLKKYKIIIQENPKLRVSIVTLTVKNGNDIKERLDHFKKCSSKLHERGRRARAEERGWHSEFRKVVGSFGSIEITKDNGYGENKDTGWHVHGHFLVLHDKQFDFEALKAEWLKITGDSDVVNVRPLKNTDDLTQDFNTILRYITKSSELTEDHSELTPEQTMELYEISRGQHFCDPYGVFRGIKIPKSYLDIDPQDESAPSMYFQYFPDSGYNRLV